MTTEEKDFDKLLEEGIIEKTGTIKFNNLEELTQGLKELITNHNKNNPPRVSQKGDTQC